MVWRLCVYPTLHTRGDLAHRITFCASRPKEIRDQAVEFKRCIMQSVSVQFADVNAAAFAKLHPAATGQITIGRAHGVGMNFEAMGKLACAWQFFIRLQITADDAKRNLRDEL